MPVVRLPADLDEELQRIVPRALRGHKKMACRIRYAVGEYMKAAGDDNGSGTTREPQRPDGKAADTPT